MSCAAKVSTVVASSEVESMNKFSGSSLRPRVVLTEARLLALRRSNLIRRLDGDPPLILGVFFERLNGNTRLVRWLRPLHTVQSDFK